MQAPDARPIVVIGGGPAGLTAAYLLARQGVPVIVLEADRQVGGIARTVEHRGYRFDIGGHRFFTKVAAVQRLWHAMLGHEFQRRPRKSRIYFRGRFFDYPLRADSALRSLGPVQAAAVVVSYLRRRLRPVHPEVSFEDWTRNRFGDRLYEMFFKTYTEKVWGIPCDRIGAQWAAQRIKGLSLWTAARAMLDRRPGRKAVKSLIEEFEYPRLGPGMMWETFQSRIRELGGEVRLGARVTRLFHDGRRVTEVGYESDGGIARLPCAGVVSTTALQTLVRLMVPGAPAAVRAHAARLRYRDFLTVGLIVEGASLFDDQWIYVHDPGVRVGRIQNFSNWSPDMVPDHGHSALGLEYFCQEGDDLWAMADADLRTLATREVESLGLLPAGRVLDAIVIRVPKAYPVYDDDYESAVQGIRDFLGGFANLQTAGRNGLHKYNNQDHSMVTAALAVSHLLGRPARDPWLVNQDDEYHEEMLAESAEDWDLLESTQPIVPTPVPSPAAGAMRAAPEHPQ